MTLANNFELMANYNQWMNGNIYAAAAKMCAADLAQDRGAYFGSVLGSLNHILVGDTIWLKRFAEHPSALSSLEYIKNIDTPKSLNTILHQDFHDLQHSRIKMDAMIKDFSTELTDSILATTLTYRNTEGNLFERKLGALVMHFFNHQTHHRGQISTLLNQAGIDVGVTDLSVLIPS